MINPRGNPVNMTIDEDASGRANSGCHGPGGSRRASAKSVPAPTTFPATMSSPAPRVPLHLGASHLAASPTFVKHASRRSSVLGTQGMVACSQPLAASAGTQILEAGGNAADAAVAVAAALAVTEPSSTGIGGDVFCLFYSAKDKAVRALNGSGRSPAGLTLDRLLALGPEWHDRTTIPETSAHSVTVPGAAAAWYDVVQVFGGGHVNLEQVLAPAIRLAERGFPVSEISANMVRCPFFAVVSGDVIVLTHAVAK